MAAKGRRGRRQPPIRGFRPGKEPAHLKRQRAKARLGADAPWAQKKAVDALAGRSPQEVASMVKRWSKILLAAAVLLAVVGGFLYGWSIVAGGVVHVLAAVIGFLGYRVRRSGPGWVEMAGSL